MTQYIYQNMITTCYPLKQQQRIQHFWLTSVIVYALIISYADKELVQLSGNSENDKSN